MVPPAATVNAVATNAVGAVATFEPANALDAFQPAGAVDTFQPVDALC